MINELKPKAVKKFTLILWILIGLTFQKINAQNAPISTIATVTGYCSTVTVPITATNFSNIGSCNLRITYDPAIATATSVTLGNPLMGVYLSSNLVTPGLITLGWFIWPGVTLPDNSVIFNIKFSRTGTGSTVITFVDNGNSCKWANGNSVNLTDTPYETYYHNGTLSFPLHTAPVTTAPALNNKCRGTTIDVPVKVANFNCIGGISLLMQYNSSVLTYQSFTNTSGFPGLSVGGSIPGSVTVGGFIPVSTPGITLSDNSILVTFHFTYNGGSTNLNWVDDGSSCEYTDEQYIALPQTPFSSYYSNGSVSEDVTPPTITCPGGLTASCSITEKPPYATYAAFTAAGGSASDACGINASSFILVSEVSDGNTCPEVVTRTYRIADNSGNTATCQQTVTIHDETPPTINTCPPTLDFAGCSTDVIIPLAYSESIVNVNLSLFTDAGGVATDACGVTTFRYQDSKSGVCPIIVNRSWMISDACGNMTVCNQAINITLPAPAFATPVPEELTVACGAATTSSLSYTNGQTSGCEISGSVTSTLSAQTPAGYCGGDITETWTYTDICNRTITKTHTIHVQPAAVAAFATPDPTELTVACGAATTSSLSYTNGLTGACEISGSVTSSLGSLPPTYCGGDVTETWTFTDLCSRTITKTRTIHILPATVATFANPVPSELTVACGQATTSSLSYTNGLSGACEISGTVTSSLGTLPSNYCGGDLTETWTFTDLCSRTITKTRTIHILPATVAAFANPVPSELTVACGQATTSSLSYTNGLSGACLISGSVTSTLDSYPNFCGGDITENWTFTDLCNRTITKTRIIHALPATDPVFDSHPDITIGCGTATTSWLSYSNGLTGACEISGSVISSLGPLPPNYCGGDVTETWTAHYCGTGTITTSRTIHIRPAPVAAFSTPYPVEITVACGAATTSSLSYTNGMSGECEISGSVTSSLSDQTPAGYCGGDITETWTFTDLCNRTITKTRINHVSPAPAAYFVNSPVNITVPCGGVPPIPTVGYTNGQTSPCEISGSVTATRIGSSTVCGGSFTDSWTYTDLCNRTITGSRTITVDAASLPVFASVADITVQCGQTTTSELGYDNGGLLPACKISGSVTSTLSAQNPSGYCGGDITETWSVLICGQTITQSRTIHVQPAAMPVFAAVTDITIPCGAATTSSLGYDNNLPEPCKISGSVTSTLSAQNPLGYCGGDITETWSVVICGQTITQTRTIHVQPAAMPVFASVSDITVPCGAATTSSLGYDNNLPEPCKISGSVTSTLSSQVPAGYCGGDITETWSVVICGQTITQARIIHVQPAAMPVFAAVTDITVPCGGATTSVLGYDNNLPEPCKITGSVTSTLGSQVPAGFCGGDITETWSVVICGQTITQSRTIHVQPAAMPVFTGVSDITIPCGAATTSVLGYDNNLPEPCRISGSVTSTLGSQVPSGYCGGNITETWSVVICGQTITQTRIIHVQPAAMPVFTGVSDITVPCGAATTSILGYDNNLPEPCKISGSVTSTLGSQVPAGYCGGDITETWSVVICGQTITQSRTIHVQPAAMPVFTSVSDITVACGAATTSVLGYDNNLPEPCKISGSVTSTLSAQNPTGYCGGDITETWSVVICGQTITQTRIIHVQPAAMPVFAGVSDITVPCGAATTSVLGYDNNLPEPCKISGSVTSTLSAQNPTGYCGGDITETWSVVICGQTITQTRIIHVQPAAMPVFAGVSDITVPCGAATTSSLGYDNNLPEPCKISGSVTSTLSTQNPLGYCGGDITETWSVVICGQTITQARIIHVQPAAMPVFAAVTDITVPCGAATTSSLGYDNNLPEPCKISGSVTSTLSAQNPSGYCGGDITETWSVVICGQTITQSRTIHVQPAAMPVFTGVSDITIPCGAATTSVLGYDNNLPEPCKISGSVTSTLSAQNPLGYCGGDITETWSVVICGQTITQTRTIHVQPAAMPVFASVSDITVPCGAATTSVLGYDNNLPEPCKISGSVTSTLSAQNPSGYCGGDITETWSVVICGQTITQSRTIHVQPAAMPVFAAVTDITVPCGGATTSVLGYDNNLPEPCRISGSVTSTLGSQVPAGFCGGDITETWSVVICGQTITQSRTIHVQPAAMPVFTGVSDITIPCGAATTSVLGYDNNLPEPCRISGSVTSTLGSQVPSGYCGGNITETWSVVICGQTITQTRIIHVQPAAMPVFVGVSDITVPCGGATTSVLGYDNNLPEPCRISGSVTSTLSAQNPLGYCGGDITETWSVVICGQTITQARIIHVQPAAMPVFTGVSDITVPCGAATTSVLGYDNNLPEPCRISGSVTSTLGSQVPAGYCGGDITETWSVVICGQTISTSRIIHVSPATMPVFASVSDITVPCGSATTSVLGYDNNLPEPCKISGSVTSTLSAQNPFGYCGGDITETWSVVICGQTITQSRIIHVQPAAMPVFVAVTDITVPCGGATTSVLGYDNNLPEPCKISGSVTSTLSAQNPLGYCGGDITETWSVVICGQTITQSRTIHVKPAAMLVFVGVSDITVPCGGATTSVLGYDNNLPEPCRISGSVTSTLGSQVPAGYCGGDITETWSVVICGQTISTSRIIHVSPATMPVFASVSDITVPCGSATTSVLGYDNNLPEPCKISGSVTSTLSAQNPFGYCGGDITETWSVVICGQTITQSRIIHVQPAAMPVFAAVTDITVPCGGATTSVLGYDNNLAEPCKISGSVTSTLSAQNPFGYCGGDITETWSVVICGQTITQTRIIHVQPAAMPVFAGVSDITVPCGAAITSVLGYDNNLPEPCKISGSVTSTLSAQNPSGYCGGDITETWSVVICGQTITQSRIIHVQPAAMPVFAAVTDITVPCGGATTSVLGYDNNLPEPCKISGSVTSTLGSQVPAGYCGGDITETWSVVICGQTITQSRTIHVQPAAMPVFAAVTDITVPCGGVTTSVLGYDNNLAEPCKISGSVTSTLSAQNPFGYCGGDITETWSVVICGQTITKSRIIHLQPAAMPVFAAAPDITVPCGSATTSSLGYDNNLAEPCRINGSVTSTLSAQNPLGYCGGDITETWSVVICGQTITQSRIIHVQPAAMPVFAVVTDITVPCGGATTSVLGYDNNLAEPCKISGSVTSTLSAQNPTGYCGGDITETWSVVICGQTITQARIIHVQPAAMPVFAAAPDITVPCGSATTSSLGYDNNLAEPCRISGSVTSTLGSQVPAGYCGGDITETWTLVICGQTITKTRIIHVQPAAMPAFAAASDITVACGAAMTSDLGYTNGLPAPCLISGTATSTLSAQNPLGYCGGDITETWSVVICGQTITKSRIIHVQPAAMPVFAGVSDITVPCGSATTSVLGYDNNLPEPCRISGSVTSTLSAQNPSGYCGGDITETWSVVICGQTITQSRTIHVQPAAIPVFAAVTDITVPCGGATTSVLGYDNNLPEPCRISGSVTSTLSVQNPSGYCGGDITETWSVVICGQTITQSRTIHVQPAAMPVFAAVTDITVPCGGATTSVLDYDNNLAEPCRISGSVTSMLSAQNPSGYCGGDITETWSVVICGNTITKSRIIHVQPATMPVFASVSDITVPCGSATISVLGYDNNLAEPCKISGSVTSTLSAQNPFGYCGGDITETWSVVICGQTITQSRIIHVQPAAMPVFAAVTDITVPCGGATTSILGYDNNLPEPCKISGSVTSTLGSQVPAGYCGGDITETWSVVICGQTITQSRIIHVQPAAMPVFAAVTDITVPCGGATTSVLGYDNNLPEPCKISGSVTSTLSSQVPAGYCGGDITETWSVVICGQTITQSRTIHVQPAAMPVFAAAPDITVPCGAATTSSLGYDNNLPEPCKISGSVTSTLSAQNPLGYCGGDITETWSVVICGQTITQTRIIHVQPVAMPVFVAVTDITVPCGGATTSVLGYDNNLPEPCKISGSVTSTLGSQVPAGYCGGDITETWSVVICGQTITQARIIHVQPAAMPVFASVTDITVPCGGATTSVLGYDNNLPEPCRISGSVTSTLSAQNPSGYCGGDITETWSVVICGQTISTSRIIHVSPAVMPVFASVTDITVPCGGATTSVLGYDNNLPEPCRISGSVTSTLGSQVPAGYCGGDITETWSVVICGQTITQTRIIHVQPAAMPVFAAVTDITVPCGGATTSVLGYDNNLAEPCKISGSVTSTLSAQNPSGYCGGDITETWSVLICGQTITQSRTIHVQPAAMPVFAAVTDITIPCGAATTSSLGYDNNLPEPCKISGSVTSTLSAQNPLGYCGGDITETWSVVICGQTITQTRTIHVQPAAMPVFASVSDITVPCGAATTSSLGYDNNLPEPCKISGSVTSTLSSQVPAGYCGGDITETWSVVICGQTITQARIIHVQPAAMPVFAAVTDITVPCGGATTSVLGYDNNLPEPCKISGSVTSTLGSQVPAGFCGGDITETWSVVICGQTITQSRTIHVQPAAMPVFTGVSDITIPCGAATTSVLGYDNNLPEPCKISGSVTSTLGSQVPSGYCGGNITETWSVVICGQTITQTRIIHVQPAAMPVFTGVSDITVPCGAATTSILGYDNNLPEPCKISGSVTSTLSAQNPSGYCGGDITETWSVVICGQTITQTRIIHVQLAAMPVFAGVSDITVPCGAATTSSLGYDNNLPEPCKISGSVTSSLSTQNPLGYCGGDITETWSVVICGQTITQSRTIHVQPAAMPVFVAVTEITVPCGGATTSVLGYDNNLPEPCKISGSVTSTLGSQVPAGYCGGDITETWSVLICGQTITQSRTIHVQPAAMPVFAAVTDITIPCGAATTSSLGYDNNLPEPCKISGSVTSTLSAQNPSGYCGGDITETWSVVICGQTITQSRTIHVQPAAMPVFAGVSDITVPCGSATTSVLGYDNNLPEPCRISGSVTSTLGSQVPAGYCGGDITETWSVVICGQTITQTRIIHVQPAAMPVFVAVTDITVPCGGATTSVLGYDNNLPEPCKISGTATSTLSTQNPLGYCGGDITETWSVVICGQTITQTRTIHVQPAAMPVFASVSDITVPCGAATTSVLGYDNNLPEPCKISGSVTSTLSAQNPSGYCGGDITETWSVVICGQTITQSRTIHVQPAAMPVFAGVSDITVPCGSATTSILGYDNNLPEPCRISGSVTSTLGSQVPAGYCGGDITETWSVVICGQTITQSRTIHVQPAAMPVFTSVSDITVACGAATTSVLGYDNNLPEPCKISGSVTSTLSTQNPLGYCGGDITETWSVVICGQTITQARIIHVQPAAMPVFAGVSDITVPCGAATTSSLGYDNNLPEPCKISGSVTSTLSTQNPLGYCGGDITETWSVVICGQTITQSRTIHVQPAAMPVFAGVSDITVPCGSATTSVLGYDNNLPEPCKISGSVTSTLSAQNPLGYCGGVITETWSVVICGQTITQTRIIHVQPAAMPVFAGVSDITVPCGAATTSSLGYDNNLPEPCKISGSVTSTLSTQNPLGYCGGDITETWSVVICGQTITQARIIHVQPAAMPVFAAVTDITVPCGAATTSSLGYDNNLPEPCKISGSVTSTLSAQNPSGYCGGDITETWSVVICGQTITQSRTIHVQPAAMPVFTSVSDITVACGAATTSVLGYDNNLPEPCKISGSVTSTLSTQNPLGYCGGDITETWSVVICGQTITQTRTIHVQPAAMPVFASVSDITVPCGAATTSSLGYDNNLPEPCKISGSVTSTLSSQVPAGYCGGDITETWSVVICGQTITQARIIHVQPAAMPVFVAVTDITVPCGDATTSVLGYDNNLPEPCKISGSVTSTLGSQVSAGYCGGDITETWSVVICGQTITQARIIHVQPAAMPVFAAVTDITVPCGGATTSVLGYDNNLPEPCKISGSVTSTLGSQVPAGYCGGDITETWSVVICGQTITQSRTIHVQPAAMPVFAGVSDITVPCGAATTSVLGYDNNLPEPCRISGSVTSTLSAQNPLGYCGGDITETWSVVICGQTITQSRTIHVQPAAMPVFAGVSDITVPCGSATTSVLGYDNNLPEPCKISGSVTSTLSAQNPTGYCGGDITETWSVVICGQTITQTRIIHVQPAAMPVFAGVSDITVPCGAATTSSLGYDNNLPEPCKISGSVTSTLSTQNPLGYCGGDITETWSVVICGQTITQARIIHVQPAAMPVFASVTDITVPCGGATTSVLGYDNNLPEPCRISGSVTSTLGSQVPAGYCGGDITETWSVVICGQTITQTRIIHVQPAAMPVFVGVSDITVPCGGATTSVLGYDNNLPEPCRISGSVTSTLSAQNPLGYCGGDITETWSVVICGQTISISRIIHVDPALLPTMTAPSDIAVDCNSIPAASTLTYTNGLSGGCLISGTSDLSTFTTIDPGHCNGKIRQEWTGTDNCGRAIVAVSRIISVIDNTPPTITCTGDQNRTASISNYQYQSVATEFDPLMVNDDCSTPVLISGWSLSGATTGSGTSTTLAGEFFNVGNTLVTWTAKDACDNTNTCSFTVHVDMPTQFTISGTLKYYKPGSVNIALGDVTLWLLDDSYTKVAECTTLAGIGNYSFNGVNNGNYYIIVHNNPETVGGINATDASLVNWWSTHPVPIERVKFQAGDVAWSSPGTPYFWINSTDAYRIQQYFVYGTEFDRAIYSETQWTYWKAAEMVISDNIPGPVYFDENLDMNVTVAGSSVNYQILALAIGDYNSSLNPVPLKDPASETLTLSNIDNHELGPNSEIELPVRMVNASKVGASSIIMNFPGDIVEVNDVVMRGGNGQLDWSVIGNELRIGWYTAYPLSLAAGADLFTLKLKTTSSFSKDKQIRFTLSPDLRNELADDQYNIIPDAVLNIDLISGSSIGIPEQPGPAQLTLENHPNPFADYTTLFYTLPFDGQVTLTIHSMIGEELQTLVKEFELQGDHSLRFNTTDLPTGFYTATIRLKNNGNELIRTIKLIRSN